MATYQQQADQARSAAAKCKTEGGRRRALNRAAELDDLAAAGQRIAERAAATAQRLPRTYESDALGRVTIPEE